MLWLVADGDIMVFLGVNNYAFEKLIIVAMNIIPYQLLFLYVVGNNIWRHKAS